MTPDMNNEKQQMYSAGLVLVAGGSGSRFNSKQRKQYVNLDGKPIIIHTLAKFINIEEISEIVIVLPENDIEFVRNEVSKYFSEYKKLKFVIGGSERVYSVINGFNSLTKSIDIVLIHDAVRPFIEKNSIVQTIMEAKNTGAAIVAVSVKDTLKKTNDNLLIEQTLNRQYLYAAQTPQVFKREVFEKAIENWRKLEEPAVTDDAMLVELMNYKVKIVEGSYTNIKITKPEDMILARAILFSREYRTCHSEHSEES
ncbi:MAG: 2-C-methyl-D-erythritol 4-phosphate cytidylyltransferase [Planctomycetes bacterium]|nr:2-C-methyl-D-erythritol 4-phosphate cytidylyltransferase [Planctomycetota bacterium]